MKTGSRTIALRSLKMVCACKREAAAASCRVELSHLFPKRTGVACAASMFIPNKGHDKGPIFGVAGKDNPLKIDHPDNLDSPFRHATFRCGTLCRIFDLSAESVLAHAAARQQDRAARSGAFLMLRFGAYNRNLTTSWRASFDGGIRGWPSCRFPTASLPSRKHRESLGTRRAKMHWQSSETWLWLAAPPQRGGARPRRRPQPK